MADVDNRLVVNLGYSGTEQTRQYSYGGISSTELEQIPSRIKAYNANVPAGDKLVFVSDTGQPMTSIVSAQLEEITTTYIIQR